MKNIIILLTFLWAITSYAVAPYGIKGQQQAATLYSNVHQFPNNQVTNLGGINALVETGNTNILSNPSFEHSTFSTSWTNSAGTFTQETSVLISGKASAKLVLAAQAMSLTQSSTLYAAQFADGVQGLAMVRIKSDIALKVCSIQAGTVSTSNCVTTATDSKWGLYKVPFILGATSNGVSIASTGSVTGTVYIDDAFVGAVDLKQDISSFATILNAEGNGGTSVTANVTNITFNEITDTTNSWNGTTFTIPETGTYAITAGVQFTAAASKYIAIYINGTVYRTLSDVSVLTTPFNKGDYVGKFTKGDIISIRSSGTGTLTNVVDHFLTISQSTASSVYTASCGTNCVDTFSANVTAAGVVTSQVSDFISGSCSVTAVPNKINCTFKSGLFTVSPSCVAQNNGASTGSVILATSTTTSGFSVNYVASVVREFNVICQKQGADFVATRTIQGSFNNVQTTAGVTKPVTFGIRTTTACSTGSCPATYYGTALGSNLPAFVSTGVYTLAIPSGVCSVAPICPEASGSLGSFSYSCHPIASSTTNIDIRCYNQSGTAVNEAYRLLCSCEAP